MTIRLSHIALACPQIEKVAQKLKTLSLSVETTCDIPTEKVRAAFLPLSVSDHLRVELLEPQAEDSPISKFLAKRPDGGLHHLSFEVSDLEKWQLRLQKEGIEILPPGIRKGARGRALFIHPKSMGGVLVELEEIA